jgi:hypothetical protein
MDYFDYETVARQAGLTSEQLQLLAEAVRRDYPSDPMLFELHVFRACRAIRDGAVSFEQVIAEPAGASPGHKT